MPTDPPASAVPSLGMRQAFFAAAMATTERYSKELRKHVFILIGVVMYIAFVVMATVFYAPSYYACLAKNGPIWAITNSMVHAMFIVFLLFYCFQSFLVGGKDGLHYGTGEVGEFAEAFAKLVPYGLGVCILFLVVSYGILFFSCQNPIQCEGCSPSKRSAFTDLVTKQVNRNTPFIEQLYDYYREEMGDRIPVALCRNYYSGIYREGVLVVDDNEGVKACGKLEEDEAPPQCMLGPATGPYELDEARGTTRADAGPTLGQFFVMTSSRTCVVQNQYDGYVSAAMIRVALRAGARCLDFDLSNFGYGKNAFPIVTVTRERDNVNLQRNFVRFEDVLKTIVDEWIHKWPYQGTPHDPLFLHLRLGRGMTTECMNQVAYLLQHYLNEQPRSGFLLPPGFHYAQINQTEFGLGGVNLCALFNRIVILVNAPHRAPSPLLDGLINGLTGMNEHKVNTKNFSYGYHETDWSAANETEQGTMIDRTRFALYYVETSYHPYSSVSERLGPNEGGLTNDLNATYTKSDGLYTLMMNKQSINNDALSVFARGCQFHAMNLQNLDGDLKLYLSVFKKTSFVLKPQSMWPKVEDSASQRNVMCREDETAYFRQTETQCYELCLPADAPDSMHQTVQTKGFAQTKEAHESCSRLDPGDGTTYFLEGLKDLQEDTGVADALEMEPEALTYEKTHPDGKVRPAMGRLTAYVKGKKLS